MDKISKALKKFNSRENVIIAEILKKLKKNDLKNLEIKKLKNKKNVFRIRKGKIRIIYIVNDNNEKNILAIERRNNHTYNFYA